MADQTWGIDDGKIVIDSYSGEAMDPRFYQAWRGFCLACNNLRDAISTIHEQGVEWDAPTAGDIDDYAPFVWRELTPDEQAWSEAEYERVQPW